MMSPPAQEIEPTWVYCHDLATGERRPLARPRKAGHPEPGLNQQGTHILYNRQDLDPAAIRSGWSTSTAPTTTRSSTSAPRSRRAPRGSLMAAASWSSPSTATYRRVGVWDRGDGGLRWLVDDPARNIEWAFVPSYTDGAVAVLVEVAQARSHASLLDTATGAETPLPDVPGDLIPLRPAPDDEWLAFYHSSRQPDDVVRLRLDALRPDAFLSLSRVWERTPLRPADLAPAESVTWSAGDGLAI